MMKRVIALMSGLLLVACAEPLPEDAAIDQQARGLEADEIRVVRLIDDLAIFEWMKPLEQEPMEGALGEGVHVDLTPPAPVVEPLHRTRRRMDIDQLEATIEKVSGGMTWTQGNTNQFQALAQTLGKPDYVNLTGEDLEPSALFQKFLDDASRQVCDKMVAKEQGVSLDSKILMLHAGPQHTWADDPGKILNNLQHLLLRFHGRYVATDAPEMERWRWLYESAEFVSQDPTTAWRTVCVGLMVHPFFYTY